MSSAPPPPPPILLVHSDQHRFDSLGVNGNRIVRTPNLDALAAEGTNFTHAFTPCPICSPARASLLTGQWATQHGCICILNTESYRWAHEDRPVLTQLLKDRGYYVGWVGKFHGEVKGGPTDYGVDAYIGTWPYREWRKEQGLPPVPSERGLFGEIDHACPADKSPIAWQADRVIEMLDTAVAAGKPVCLRWDPPEPHLPCKPPAEWASQYDPSDIPPWPSFGDTQAGKPSVQARQLDIWGLNDWSWDDFAPIVALYYAVISEIDFHFGRILERFKHHGLLDDALVIYSTDHGDYCGGHRQMDKHFAMYDDVVHVPLMVRWPGKVQAGATCDHFVSNELDIATTLLRAAGIEVPETFEGRDLVAEIKSENGAGREDIFSQYFGTESGLYSQRMVRDRRFKYVFNPTSIDEFYDLESDPGELTNRIDDPACAEDIARLRRRMVDWMESIGDRLCNRWTKVHLLGEPPLGAGMR